MTPSRVRAVRAPLLRLALPLLALLGGAWSTPADAQELPADTVQVDRVAPDSVPLSARSALLRSLVLPGWGQSYVGAHGRGALYFALEGASLWMVYKSSRSLAAARRLESSLRENGALGADQRLELAQSRAQQVEDWITLSIFWALFAGADAYVSAQLADFAGHVGAAPGPAGEVRLQVQFDVGGRP